MRILENKSLRNYCTYRLGGSAKMIVEADGSEVIDAVSRYPSYFVLGAGSKLLISDSGYNGTIIKLCGNSIQLCNGFVTVDAGVKLPYLSNYYCVNGLSGLEFACSIPGSVGGAIKMNAGAFGGDMSKVVHSVTVLRNGKIMTLDANQLSFGYRTSGINNADIVLGARLKYVRQDKAIIAEAMNLFKQSRSRNQPSGYSCGSVFKAYDNKPAWQYIEGCGLKGYCINDAQISEKHCNFILNRGNASATDVKRLIDLAKARVHENYGVALEEEVIYLGDFG